MKGEVVDNVESTAGLIGHGGLCGKSLTDFRVFQERYMEPLTRLPNWVITSRAIVDRLPCRGIGRRRYTEDASARGCMGSNYCERGR